VTDIAERASCSQFIIHLCEGRLICLGRAREAPAGIISRVHEQID
jgi:hypothetical protein